MNRVMALVAMLHESPDLHSGTRLFCDQPVLSWTLRRLSRARSIRSIIIMCWEDQVRDIAELAGGYNATVFSVGARRPLPALQAITAAQKFSDGWRGGLHGTGCFDRGFFAPWVLQVAQQHQAEALFWMDASSGLIDPRLIDELVVHADEHMQNGMIFSQAAPGLNGLLIRQQLLVALASAQAHPGQALCYNPAQPAADPISSASCASVPTGVARCTHHFRLSSNRQIHWLEHLVQNTAGDVEGITAEQLVFSPGPFDAEYGPREVVVELTARRKTEAIYRTDGNLHESRPDMPLQMADELFAQLSQWDDLRLTFAGAGDPLLHPQITQIIASAQRAGIGAIHIETDFVDVPDELIHALIDLEVDVVSVDLPAMDAETYKTMMQVDALPQVIQKIKTFVEYRHQTGRGAPLIVPTFVKCPQNIGQMEAWYDQWLGAVGSAVIKGSPAMSAGSGTTAGYGGGASLMVLSDGRISADEMDYTGAASIGVFPVMAIASAWERIFDASAIVSH